MHAQRNSLITPTHHVLRRVGRDAPRILGSGIILPSRIINVWRAIHPVENFVDIMEGRECFIKRLQYKSVVAQREPPSGHKYRIVAS